jgi:diaminopropionate ammonia-lyase
MRSLDAAGIPSGESGAAALAGAMALAEGRAAADALLGATTTVVLFDTEGVTDPERYAAIVSGRC